jgi:hypothetical protein
MDLLIPELSADQAVAVPAIHTMTVNCIVAKERPARDILADGDITAAQAQQVKTAHNLAPLSMAAVVVVVQEKKVSHVGVGTQMPRAVTE